MFHVYIEMYFRYSKRVRQKLKPANKEDLKASASNAVTIFFIILVAWNLALTKRVNQLKVLKGINLWKSKYIWNVLIIL